MNNKFSYIGHRQRLKERFMKGPQYVHDYEICEMLLFYKYKRCDVKSIAKKIIDQGWEEILLCKNEKYITFINMINRIIIRLRKAIIKQTIILKNQDDIFTYCNENHIEENIRILWLDKNYCFLGETISNFLDEYYILNAGIKIKASIAIIIITKDISPDMNILRLLLEALSSIHIYLHHIFTIDQNYMNIASVET